MDIRTIIKTAGGPSKVAAALRLTHPTIIGWSRVPAEHAITVSRLTGIPVHELRPDVFPAPLPSSPTPAQEAA